MRSWVNESKGQVSALPENQGNAAEAHEQLSNFLRHARPVLITANLKRFRDIKIVARAARRADLTVRADSVQ
jgi:hypothetical protein